MTPNKARSWWTRNLWAIVLFPTLAAASLAGVSVFKGWLHNRAGFDSDGKPIADAKDATPESDKKPRSQPRTPMLAEAGYGLILDDLKRHDPEMHSHLRYLTLWHRHNEPSCSSELLDADRQALRELTALLAKGNGRRAEFIDPDHLILRLDLADVGWDVAGDWRQVCSQYRYGLMGGDTQPLPKLMRQVEELTEEKIPVIRADWFVAAATRSPLAGPKGIVGTPASELPESVRSAATRYSSQTLDATACARELGLLDPHVLQALIEQKPNLQEEFGLAPLIRGGTIRREWWEGDKNYFSPYQELARLLKVGKPVRVP